MIQPPRPYHPNDLPAVRELHKASFAALAQDSHTPEQIAAHLGLIDREDYAADLGRSHLLVMENGAELAATSGWLAHESEPATARIRKVFVRPDLARQGVGKYMVMTAEKIAASNGYRRFFVRANVNAVPLYRALGYRPVDQGEMPAAGGVVLPVVFMRKG